MTVYEQLESMFNEASPTEKCKITDKLDAMAKNFNKYIDENYYPCPYCFKVIPYGEAIANYEPYARTVPKHHPSQDVGALALEVREGYEFKYYCPHCGTKLWADYKYKLNEKLEGGLLE